MPGIMLTRILPDQPCRVHLGGPLHRRSHTVSGKSLVRDYVRMRT